jgi:arylsulfatase
MSAPGKAGAIQPVTAIEFPPMQKGASFNLAAVKGQIEKAIQSQAGR